ncbi:MAG: hypothetical protein ACOZFS_09820 [Thermodesulfobacteriota bacterium]
MKFRLCRLEFVVEGMEDIRFLFRVWQGFLIRERLANTEAIMVYVTVGERRPGKEVSLNFSATEEVIDEFLSILKEGGLNFTCKESIPGLMKTCRLEDG